MNNMDKTIPYRLSLAELENFKILRKKTNPSSFNGESQDVEGQVEEEIRASDSVHETLGNAAQEKTVRGG
jgi:hypothetical protein